MSAYHLFYFVKLAPTLKEIPRYAFGYCESLEYIDIPGSVTFIGSFAFVGCTSLENIILPTSLQKMHEFGMFSGCTSLKEVVIPYGTTFIGGHAFENCTNLRAVYIPDTVTSIGILNIIENCPNAIVYCGDGSKTAEQWFLLVLLLKLLVLMCSGTETEELF